MLANLIDRQKGYIKTCFLKTERYHRLFKTNFIPVGCGTLFLVIINIPYR